MKRTIYIAAVLIIWLHGFVVVAETIPAAEIAELQSDITSVSRSSSAVEIRRACKSVLRKADGLLQRMPEAPNRYEVLSLVFNVQMRLLALENTTPNREAVYATGEKLVKAPDAYADLRLEADLILNERDLSGRNATVDERVAALRALLSRYRGTSAEWRSLQIGARIATKLLAFDLEQEIQATMAERFVGDHRAIAQRCREENVKSVDAVFSGSYTNTSGEVVVFPFDRLGHHTLVLFWSAASAEHEQFLRAVKEQQDRFRGRFEIYSFNTDELPDAGEAILRRAGLDATAFLLPGGAQHSAVAAYGGTLPTARLVNGQGRIFLHRDQSLPWPQRVESKSETTQGPGLGLWLDDESYLAQLRYLFSGSFLPPGADVVPRFRLAMSALRNDGADPEVLLPDMLAACGDSAASLAAVTVLALAANSRTMYETYRQRSLSSVEGEGNPALWSFYAFLRDQLHQYRLFWASPAHNGYPRSEKYNFRYVVGGFITPTVQSVTLKTTFSDLAGKPFRIPGDGPGDMVGVIFAEPPAEAVRSAWMESLHTFVDAFREGAVGVIVAVLSEDTNTVAALTRDFDPPLRVAVVSDGMQNPLVRRLGILNAGAVPNPFLIRPDGTVAWSVSGLQYHGFRQTVYHAIRRAIGNNIAKVRTDPPFKALERGDYRKALGLFADDERSASAPYTVSRSYAAWTAARWHGRALAYAGLGDWSAALLEIDKAIARRRADFKSGLCKCHGVVEMYLTRAMILEHLDRAEEAEAARQLAAAESVPHPELAPLFTRSGIPAGVYYDLLARVRRALQEGPPPVPWRLRARD